MLHQVVRDFGHGRGADKLAALARAHHGLHHDVAVQAVRGVGGAFDLFQQRHIGAVFQLQAGWIGGECRGASLLRRVDDGLVARAAAEVAAQGIGDLLTAQGLLGAGDDLNDVRQAHGDARRAKTALAAVALHQSLLDGVQAAIGLFQALDGFDRFAIQRRQQLNAGIDGHIVNRRASGVQLAHQHHTRPAIALGTTFFRAGAVQLFAQIVQNSGGTAFALRFNDAAIEHKTHGIGDLGHGRSDQKWATETPILFLILYDLHIKNDIPITDAPQDPR